MVTHKCTGVMLFFFLDSHNMNKRLKTQSNASVSFSNLDLGLVHDRHFAAWLTPLWCYPMLFKGLADTITL